jgi:hypothetical protein
MAQPQMRPMMPGQPMMPSQQPILSQQMPPQAINNVQLDPFGA